MVDSSVAISWGMPDEKSAAADRALAVAVRENVAVPSVFWTEVRNVCLVNERRGRIVPDDTVTAIETIAAFDPLIDETSSHDIVLTMARKHGLSAYDAAYLELAVRQDAILATLDKRLAKAGVAEGLAVITEVA